MSLQRINLFHHFQRAPDDSDYLTWRRFWIANIIFFIILIVVWIGSILNNYQLSVRLNAAQADLITYEKTYNTIKNTLPQFLFSSNVNETVTNLKKELAAQKIVVQILSRHTLFSKDLISLSTSIVPNVWLTKFSIEKSGDDIILIGSSFGIKNLHAFIDRLNNDPTFSGYDITIKQVNNENVKDPNAKLVFELTLVKSKNG